MKRDASIKKQLVAGALVTAALSGLARAALPRPRRRPGPAVSSRPGHGAADPRPAAPRRPAGAANKGVIAGFAATAVLSALMLVKAAAEFTPEVDVIAHQSACIGTGATPAAAWTVHVLIGTVAWGLAYAALEPHLPGGRGWPRGVAFAAGAWVLMMVTVMPLAGAGLFGLGLSLAAPVLTLVLHLVYGAVLGFTYGALSPDRCAATAPSSATEERKRRKR